MPRRRALTALPLPLGEQIAALNGPSERLHWLVEHRLLGPVDLLERRGLVAGDLASLARSLRAQKPVVGAEQLGEERRVFAGLVKAGVRALALKGCLVAYRCYPSPDQRWRADLDVLVAPTEIDAARASLVELGYRPLYSVPGGTPIEQETWVRRHDGRRQAVDLHWAVRNHPVLRDRLRFDEQWRASIELPRLAKGARGQGTVHALLNASMHWYDNIYHEPSPYGWLLDIDLLWRQLDDRARDTLVALAVERGVAGLLGDSLRLTRAALQTPIPETLIDRLVQHGLDRRPTRLIDLVGHRFRSYLFSVACEPGLGKKVRRFRSTFFPPITHMRERYRVDSRTELVRAYFRRAWARVRG